MTPLRLVNIRSLETVLSEIEEVGPLIWDTLKQRSLSEDEQIAALDRLEALQAEARSMIEHATGVSWDVILKACL